MPVRGLKEVRQRLKTIFGDIKGPRVQKTLAEVLVTAAGFAANMTPIDTSNLINSQYRKITAYGNRVVAAIGYTAAYAAAVHDAPGTLRGKEVARDKNDPSRGNVWDHKAEPGFLVKAFEDSDARAAIDAVIRKGMKI